MESKLNYNILRLARQSRGLSLEDLAIRSQIDESTLSRYENGLIAEPKLDSIQKISDILNYPISKFYDNSKIFPPISYHRSKSNTSAEQQKYNSICLLRKIELEKLIRLIDFNKKILPVIESNCLDDSIEEIARNTRRYFKLPIGPIDNLTNLFEHHGIIIFPIDTQDTFNAFSFVLESGIPIIFIDKNIPIDRYRFTLAHELGHLIMHSEGGINIEKEADSFASEFLMPTTDIEHQLNNLTFDKLKLLKQIWKTSIQSILLKTKDKEKIDKGYTELYKHGYSKKKEPSVCLQKESAGLLKYLIEKLLKHFSTDELIEVVSLTKSEFNDIYVSFSQFIKEVTPSDFNRYHAKNF